MSSNNNQSGQPPFEMTITQYSKFRIYSHFLPGFEAETVVDRDGEAVLMALEDVHPYHFDNFEAYEAHLVNYANHFLEQEVRNNTISHDSIPGYISALSIVRYQGRLGVNDFLNSSYDLDSMVDTVYSYVDIHSITEPGDRRRTVYNLQESDGYYSFRAFSDRMESYIERNGLPVTSLQNGTDFATLYEVFVNNPSYENALAYAEALDPLLPENYNPLSHSHRVAIYLMFHQANSVFENEVYNEVNEVRRNVEFGTVEVVVGSTHPLNLVYDEEINQAVYNEFLANQEVSAPAESKDNLLVDVDLGGSLQPASSIGAQLQQGAGKYLL